MKMHQIGSHIEAYPHEETKLSIYNKSTGKTFVLGERNPEYSNASTVRIRLMMFTKLANITLRKRL